MTATALDHLQLGGRIDWLAQLDTAFQPTKNYRRTSIVRYCAIWRADTRRSVANV